MKKIFTLISMALMAIGVNAQTTIFSAQPIEAWDVPAGSTDVEITSEYATITGGKMYVTSQQEEAKAMLKKQGGEFAFQCTNNNTFFKVVLNEALQAGDVISTRMQSRNDTDLGLLFCPGERSTEVASKIDLPTASVQEWTETTPYTVATGDGICGLTTFYIYRATGKSTYFNTFAITRPGGGGGGGSTEVEKWDASTADLAASIANPIDNANENFFSVPAETKIYPKGTYEAGSTAVVPSDGTPLILKNYIITASTANVTLNAVSTPNADASADEAWQIAGGGNKALLSEAGDSIYKQYIKPKNGNPSMAYKQFTEETDEGTAFRVAETYWTPETMKMPAKGLYYEFTTKTAGELTVGIRINRPTDAFYVFTKDDFVQLPKENLSISGYVNNNTVVWGTNEKAYSTINMTDDHDYKVDGIPSKEIFGFLKINAEANKTYVMLCPKGQPGLFGFEFKAGGSSGINIQNATKTWNANAPMYNLSGQKVDKSYKGIVIQNGRKFMNK